LFGFKEKKMGHYLKILCLAEYAGGGIWLEGGEKKIGKVFKECLFGILSVIFKGLIVEEMAS
jgi:hypothetical protein